MRSDKWARISARLGRLTGRKPHPEDADVALAIRDLQDHNNLGVSMRAKQLWKKWAAIVDESASAKTTDVTSKQTGASAENPFD